MLEERDVLASFFHKGLQKAGTYYAVLQELLHEKELVETGEQPAAKSNLQCPFQYSLGGRRALLFRSPSVSVNHFDGELFRRMLVQRRMHNVSCLR